MNKLLEELLEELGVKATTDFIGYDYPRWSPHKHKHYQITFTRGKCSYTLDFWASLVDSYRFEPQDRSTRAQSIQNFRIRGWDNNKGLFAESGKLFPGCPCIASLLFGKGVFKGKLVVNPKEKNQSEFIEGVLSCCELTEPHLSFDDFCAEFGYSNDSIKALETHRAVLEQYAGLRRAFGYEGLERVAVFIYEGEDDQEQDQEEDHQ